MDLQSIFGTGELLNPIQMGVRSFLMFFITLALIRLGGMRIFGKKTAFDNIIIIMLGAVLARGVVGASPFLSTVAAAAVMVLVHKVLALLSMKYTWVGKIVKGVHRTLYEDGQMHLRNMKRSAISEDDLIESLRMQMNTENFVSVKEIKMEKNGELSVIKKEEVQQG